MKIAYQHLLRFLVDKPSIEDLSTKLFQLGHEHEIEDSIFDMEFTPNRGDCLSLLGLARDLNVFYKTNLDVPIYEDEIAPLNLNFINQTMEKCPEISFLNIQINDQVSEYKSYLDNYFKDLKLNKNNFFTDVSNYIAYEMGQPTHCYEFSSLDTDITLTQNTDNTKFKTLLGSNINLRGTDLVFTSKNKIINLSGIMGGFDTACSKYTKHALIECAYFQPEAIIGRAVKYNLHSDASHKFERGTDPNCHEKVLRRFIEIVSDHAEIIKLELYKNSNRSFKEIEIDFDLEKVNKILGLKVSSKEYVSSLKKLGFGVKKNITVPSHRSDIHNQNDLSEELARVVGYDNIPTKEINLKNVITKGIPSNELKIKSFLINNGFSEVINSPFCSKNILDSSIKVDNPLDSKREFIRTNLTDSLLENLIYNENRQKDSIKIFEISDIYSILNGVKKEKRLALIVSGRKGHNYKDFTKKLDDKYLEMLFQELKIDISSKILKIDRKNIDSKIKTPIYGIELKIDDLPNNISVYNSIYNPSNDFIRYKPISEFPSSFRDLSFSVRDSSKIHETISVLSNVDSDILKKCFMFDFYQNDKTQESKIGFRFIFQSNKRTLTDSEIDYEIKQIIKRVLAVKSTYLPGL